jgi:hypothetical protein
MITREDLAGYVADCEAVNFQLQLCDDLYQTAWESTDTIPLIIFEWDGVEYSSSPFQQAEVLDIAWSTCRLGLN